MAIFASTTTSGYSDPLKAMNIKALEARLKDQQAQMAAEKPDAAMMATIPGGIGHVLGQVGDRMAQARSEQALVAQKDMLAKAMTGYDMNSGPPPPVIATADPDLYKSMLQQWAENRRQRDLFGHQDAAAKEAARVAEIARGQGYTHTDAAAAQKVLDDQVAAKEAARVAEIARQQGYTHDDAKAAQKVLDDQVAAKEAARVAEIAREQGYTHADAAAAQKTLDAQTAPQSDAAKIAADVASGRITKEQGDALISKLSAPSATETKAGNELQNSALGVQGVLTDLKEARDLMGPEGKGIRAGTGAGFSQWGSKIAGDTLGLSDPTLTKNTERYNQIVNSAAIEAMVEKLKGATTDFELREFKTMMNDPNYDPVNKVKAINRMIEKAEAHAALQQDQMKRAKVSAPAGPAGSTAAMSEENIAASLANAKAAVESGKWTVEQANAKLRAAGVPRGL